MTQWSPHSKYDHGFAIVRFDTFQKIDPREEPEVAVTVKKIVWSQDVAESEITRLNQLNRDKGVVYFWTITRVERRAV
jgi:hypothetical protein